MNTQPQKTYHNISNTFCLVLLFLLCSSLGLQAQALEIGDEGNVNIAENLNVEKTVQAQTFAGYGIVPIGTIIDWWRADADMKIPDGFEVADGTKVQTSGSPIKGKTKPNLVHKFVRGATETEIGTKGYTNDGGADSASHKHSVSTGDLTAKSSGGHNHRWLYRKPDGGIYSYNASNAAERLIKWDNGMDGAGSGIYPIAWSKKPDSQTIHYTHKVGDHTHTVTGVTKNTSVVPIATIPKYVGLLKLIRVL